MTNGKMLGSVDLGIGPGLVPLSPFLPSREYSVLWVLGGDRVVVMAIC